MLKITLGENVRRKHRNRTDLNIETGTTTIVSRMFEIETPLLALKITIPPFSAIAVTVFLICLLQLMTTKKSIIH